MRIEAVAFKNFPPFADVTVKFPPRASDDGCGEVHLLTGQNGTGKTSLLCLFAAACGNRGPLDARIANADGLNAVVAGSDGKRGVLWFRNAGNATWTRRPVDANTLNNAVVSGEAGQQITGRTENITNPNGGGTNQTAALAFRGMARVSDAKISALAPVKLESTAAQLTFEPAKNEDILICQSMANLKMGAAMDALRNLPKSQSRPIQLVERLEGAVSQITGRRFSFDVTPHPEVRLRVFWGGVTMTLLQLPDGLRSIIGWMVSCVAKLESLFPDHPDPLSVPLILLLDEPEGHLHPAWQRKVLPAAQTLFPQAQIFAATHSPFVISSVNNGWIHIFRADESGTVTVDEPRECSKGDTYLDVVEDILGVKEWYDPQTEALLSEFRKTRDAVLAGSNAFERLETQAKEIAERSDSLRDVVAREMHQVETRLAQAAGHQ